MTEQEWQVCTNPDTMLRRLAEERHHRKLRLFAVACCYRVWHQMTDERSRRAVEVTARHIEGLASDDEWRAAGEAARQAWADTSGRLIPELYGLPAQPRTAEENDADNRLHAATSAAWSLCEASIRALPGRWARAVAHAVATETARAVHRVYSQSPERGEQVRLLRCIFGVPFRRPAVQAAWLRWNGGTVPGLAHRIYDERSWPDTPLLGDALLDAGCDNEGMLSHAREGTIHTRGCWLLDLLLNKE